MAPAGPLVRAACSLTVLVTVPSLAVAQAPAASREDGQWTMPGKDYAATRYSGLGQITAANAARLRAGLELLHRRAGRPRGPAAGGRQHACTW